MQTILDYLESGVLPPGKVILLLVKLRDLPYILEDWVEGNQECDLRVRRAKTPGHAVIELTYILYAAHIYKEYAPKVSIVERNK